MNVILIYHYLDLTKIRVISEHKIVINMKLESIKNTEKNSMDIVKELNFFGLYLKYSKEFFMPRLNVIIYFNGDGMIGPGSDTNMPILIRY